MNLLALDVGFANMGWAVITNGLPTVGGTISTKKDSRKNVRTSDDYFARSHQLAHQLREVVQRHDIGGIVGELPSGGAQSARSMAQMNMAVGIAAAVVAMLDLPSEWCTPNDVKMAVCGYRSATKDEMMNAIRAMYPDAIFPKTKGEFEHVADAVGAYLALRKSGSTLTKLAL